MTTTYQTFRINFPPGVQLVNYETHSEARFPVELIPQIVSWFDTAKARFEMEQTAAATLAAAEPCVKCDAKGTVPVAGKLTLCSGCYGSGRKGYVPPGMQKIAEPLPSLPAELVAALPAEESHGTFELEIEPRPAPDLAAVAARLGRTTEATATLADIPNLAELILDLSLEVEKLAGEVAELKGKT